MALTICRIRATEGEPSTGDDLGRAQVGPPVGEAELVGKASLGPRRTGYLDPFEHARELTAVRVGVHPHGTPDGAGDVDAELDPRQSEAGRRRSDLRQTRPAAADQTVADVLDRDQLTVELEHQPPKARVGDEQVRSGPDQTDLDPLLLGPAQHLSELLGIAGPGEEVRRAAGADRRQTGERIVAGRPARRRAHRARSLSATIDPATRSTSPAPRVSTRSPSRARPPTSAAA